MTPLDDVSPAWTRDLGGHARRLWALFGGRSRDDHGRRDDDDDDDLPRPNAVVLPIFRVPHTPALA